MRPQQYEITYLETITGAVEDTVRNELNEYGYKYGAYGTARIVERIVEQIVDAQKKFRQAHPLPPIFSGLFHGKFQPRIAQSDQREGYPKELSHFLQALLYVHETASAIHSCLSQGDLSEHEPMTLHTRSLKKRETKAATDLEDVYLQVCGLPYEAIEQKKLQQAIDGFRKQPDAGKIVGAFTQEGELEGFMQLSNAKRSSHNSIGTTMRQLLDSPNLANAKQRFGQGIDEHEHHHYVHLDIFAANSFAGASVLVLEMLNEVRRKMKHGCVGIWQAIDETHNKFSK